MATTAPFSRFEFMIAWRYLRAKRAEGGVSVMTWISLIGVTLAVFALVATLAVRAGFRTEFVDSIVGANAHITVVEDRLEPVTGQYVRNIVDYEAMAARVAEVPGVVQAAPMISEDVLATFGERDTYGQVLGIRPADLQAIPRIADPVAAFGDLGAFADGVALGDDLAQTLGVGVGSNVVLTTPRGSVTPMGTRPRRGAFTVVYIFDSGSPYIDAARIYMPLNEAQAFFSSDGIVDSIHVTTTDAEGVDNVALAVQEASGPGTWTYTWRANVGGFLQTLDTEDRVMSVIMSILVLVASMNIISGLVMLVKNKGRDIGILRTMGLSQGSILRIFFICGAGIGTLGTILGAIIGVLFALNFETLFELMGANWERHIENLPAELRMQDVAFAVGVSLLLSWTVTIFPARRAARMNPVEALRYE